MKRTSHRGLYAPELLEPRIAPATFTVTNLFGDNREGSLRKEINDANDSPGADTIVFKLIDPLLPHTITLDFVVGEILIKGPLTIKGPGIDLLTVSGNDQMRIFNIDDTVAGTLSPTTISGLTLTDGMAAGNGGAILSIEPLALKNVVVRSSYAGNRGGGVFVETDGKTSVVSSRIVHNQAGNGGGGLYLDAGAGVSVVKTTIADNTGVKNGGLYAIAMGAKSAIVVDACIVSGNAATGGDGGGLRFAGADDGKIILKNSLITGNSSTDAGGGLYLRSGNLLVSKTTVSNNTALRGGGLAGGGGKSITISGSGFLGNRASDPFGSGGGAIVFDGLGTVVKISNTIFSANTSASYGGAIANEKAATLSIIGSSFLGNVAGDDGGAIRLSDRAVLTMKSSTLSGNTSASFGGAIAVDSGGVLNLTGNKFTENKGNVGGAISVTGLAADAASTNLGGNLFQANVADTAGGAIVAQGDSVFSSKADKFIGNLVRVGQGGGVDLVNTGGIFITGSLFQSNVAKNNSGGGLHIAADATLTSVKVLDNISGPGGRGGGLRIGGAGVNVVIAKSLIAGNVANDGGGVFFDLGTATIDAVTKIIGNAAASSPNIGSA